MNNSFGKLVDGMIRFAPDYLQSEQGLVMNPSEALYLASGWKRVIRTTAEPPESKVAERFVWQVDGDTLVQTWNYEDAPPPAPRVFCKKDLVITLTHMGLWNRVKAWIAESGMEDIYLAAQEVAEDDVYFNAGLATLKESLGLTDEQVESVLAQCVKE